MKILTKKYELDTPDNLTVEHIENHIQQSGYEPLRWAIVKFSEHKMTIDAVLIDYKEAN